MNMLNSGVRVLKPKLYKSSVQWLLASFIFVFFSWLYMGNAINDCSTTTTAFNSDSTGGYAWFQWVGGNDLSWGYTDKSNFPYGESLNRPHFITSALFIFIYKIFAYLTTPICGLNVMVLLGYMSTALLMFGLVRWLFRRFDIALFAGYAAAFVPYHQLKAQSHIVYIYGSIIIAIVWAYLWFIKKPSYKKAILLGMVSASGFYFDGYFVLFTAIIIGTLFISSFVFDFVRIFFYRSKPKLVLHESRSRLKHLLITVLILGLLLLPILYVLTSQGGAIKQSLASARSDIKIETITYGARPIEFILPAFNNPLMPDKYPGWRLMEKNQHFSNPSETTLYLGWTIIVLALLSFIYLFFRRTQTIKLNGISYSYLIGLLSLILLVCLSFSLPSKVFLFGHLIPTPSLMLTEVTASWRVLARLFLAIDPLVILIASAGMYMLSKSWKKVGQIFFTAFCTLILFLEYLPAQLGITGDLYKNSPKIYHQLAADSSVDVIAEYPLTDFRNSPSIFTYQQLHKKRLLNANNSEIMKGPRHASIAGLNDTQTLGVLKAMNIDIVTTYGFDPRNDGLRPYKVNEDGRTGVYSYRINNSVIPRSSVLIIDKGYESLFVDENQISHRAITGTATMKIFNLKPAKLSDEYRISFEVQTIACDKAGHVAISQAGEKLWTGQVNNHSSTISLLVTGDKDIQLTTSCSLDVTHMSAAEASN